MTYCYPYKRGTGWRSQGFRSGPNQGANGPGGHTGFDQAMDAGTPLYAPAAGIIRNSSWVGANYLDNEWWLTQMGGDTLVLDCFGPDGTTKTGPAFILAHLSDSIAEVGQWVAKGELIALSGNSGTATTGPHVHIEALPPAWDFGNGVYGRVDPEGYFDEWPDDYISGIAAQGTINTTEDTMGELTFAQVKQAAHEGALQALEEQITDTTKQQMSVMDLARQWRQKWNEAPDANLDVKIQRRGSAFGEDGGFTTPRAMYAYGDQKHVEALQAAAAAAHADGASVESIIQAVHDGLAAGVKVEATVKVGD